MNEIPTSKRDQNKANIHTNPIPESLNAVKLYVSFLALISTKFSWFRTLKYLPWTACTSNQDIAMQRYRDRVIFQVGACRRSAKSICSSDYTLLDQYR